MVRGQQVGAQRASLKSHQEYVQGAMDRLQGRMLEGSRLLEALEIAVGRMQEAQEVQDCQMSETNCMQSIDLN